MRDCENRHESLKAYLDGELPLRQKFSLVWHLLGCSVCREERDAMRQFSAQLKEEETPLSANLRNRILNSVSYSQPLVASPKNTSRLTAYRTLAWSGGAITLLFGVLFANKMLTTLPKTSSPMSDSAGSSPSASMANKPIKSNSAQPQSVDVTKSDGVGSQYEASSNARSQKGIAEDKTAMKRAAPGLIPEREKMSKMQESAPNQVRSSVQLASPSNSFEKIVNGNSEPIERKNRETFADSGGQVKSKSALGSPSYRFQNAAPASSAGGTSDKQRELYSPQKALASPKTREPGEQKQKSANQPTPITAEETKKNVLILSEKKSASAIKKRAKKYSLSDKKKDISKFHRKYKKRKPRKETIKKSFNRP